MDIIWSVGSEKSKFSENSVSALNESVADIQQFEASSTNTVHSNSMKDAIIKGKKNRNPLTHLVNADDLFDKWQSSQKDGHDLVKRMKNLKL